MKISRVTLPDGRSAIEVEHTQQGMSTIEHMWTYYVGGGVLPSHKDPRYDKPGGWEIHQPIDGVTDREEIEYPERLLAELLS